MSIEEPSDRSHHADAEMTGRITRFLCAGIATVIVGCASGEPPTPTPAAPSDASPTPTIQDVMKLEDFAPLEPGTYVIDPDADRSTPIRVVYEVPAEGWSQWIGAAKFSEHGHVGVSITTVTNLVRHGCHDHSWIDPPVGPSVDDLAGALTNLSPFHVTSPPQDVSAYGYRGTYLEMTVPDLTVEEGADDRSFAGCDDGDLKSWVAATDTKEGDAFYGYTGPRYTEEFWILDVEGTRLVIVAGRSPDSPTDDVEEMRAILRSIRIEP